MFKKLIAIGLIVITLAGSTTAAHATGSGGGGASAKGCTLGGKTVASGTTIHLKDRWDNILRSWQCFGGAWVPMLRA